MQVSILNTSSDHSAAAAEELCWTQISTAITAPGNPIDSGYVDQQAIYDRIDLLCRSRGMPHTTPIVLTNLYLEWRGRFLTRKSQVWIDGDNVSLSMPWIEFDGRVLDQEDFESGQFSELDVSHGLTYPTCAASDGDVVDLEDIVTSSRTNAFPISMDVLKALRKDRFLPSGKLDYLAWARIFRMQLSDVVSRTCRFVHGAKQPVATTGHQQEVPSLEDQVCQLAEVMLDGRR